MTSASKLVGDAVQHQFVAVTAFMNCQTQLVEGMLANIIQHRQQVHCVLARQRRGSLSPAN